ncbi:thrombomodulin-like [Lampris incognitus]|uniref:thrombomodulin-like n=1 Tax=Lampris incognitus TaxID=2546036 RepID=UPI0024B53443|nr:thrombomodulin-like [Lampris incognitus]
MRTVRGLLALIAFTLLMSGTNGTSPDSGYCIGTQCYVVFAGPGSFRDAQTECAKKDGHLMTVRSSVSHDTLLILLGGRLGQYWIGLHLPTGCPSAAEELRGFQWVTKDAESDFYNWAAFDDACSPRCVAVSKDNDFKWTPVPCGEGVAGFLCEYSLAEPCLGLQVKGNESVTYSTPYGFGGEDLLSLPQGSVAVRRPAETKFICSKQEWLKAPWQCGLDEGGCEFRCEAADSGQPPQCVCPQGLVVDPRNNVTCEEDHGDPCHALLCDQACAQAEGGYACQCDPGFRLAEDGRTCEDDCSDPRQCPGELLKCVSTAGGFECACLDGYRRSEDGRCVDEDECASSPCEHLCSNTAGSYSCSCFEGFKPKEASSNECELHCGRSKCPALCDPNNPFQCECPVGYVVDQVDAVSDCVDIDECTMNYCEQGCRNTFGGYWCFCPQGFTLVDDYKCVDNESRTTEAWEGSGATTPFSVTPSVSSPEPTSRPSVVAAGGLLAIIVSVVVVILVAVFLARHVLRRSGGLESPSGLKEEGDAALHDLREVTGDKTDSGKPPKQDP